MMNVVAQIVVWLNAVANGVGRVLLAPIGLLPGWLSATIVGIVTGLAMLVIFKHTSNQRAIKAARDDIKANLLAMKLFKDSVFVTLKAQGRLLYGALRLFVLALVPMAVMAVPVTMLLAQLALWYQARPLQVGEEAVMTVKLGGSAGSAESAWPKVSLKPTAALDVTIGPLRVLSKRELCWNIRARAPGNHHVEFQVEDQAVDKEVAIGNGFMRVSMERPGWSWSDALLNPWERPFEPDSGVQSIAIDYPTRSSWTSGTDSWVIYWFVVSLVAAFCCRRLLGVNI
jgi:hypothetical protein